MKNRYLAWAAVGALGLASLNAQADSGSIVSQIPSYSEEWCHDVRADLMNAVRTGDEAQTNAEEVAILQAAIHQALHVGTARFQKFFRYTLEASLQDVSVFGSDLSRQAFFLRESVMEALDDLSYIHGDWDLDDNGPYVVNLLQRAEDNGARAPLDAEETLFLENGVERAMDLLDTSDYRRTPQYACSYTTLATTLNEAQDPSLSSQTRIELLRN